MSRYDDIKKRIKGNTTSTQETDIHNNSGYDAVKERIGRFGTGYTTVNNDYINKFASDVDLFNNDIGNSFNNISYANRNSIRDEYAERYKDINNRANYLRAYANSKGGAENGYSKLVDYLDSIDNAYGQYRNAFDSVDRYYSQWKTEDDYNSWREANKQTLNATEADDYAEYSKKGADIKNPSVWKTDSGINIFGWKPFREDVNNNVTYTRENYPNAVGGAKDSGMNAAYNQMTDDEVGAYNYYLAKEREGLVEKGTADEYLNSIMPYLEARSGVEYANRSGIDEDSNMALKIAFELTNSAVGNVTDAGNFLRAVTDKDYVPQNVFNEASAYVLQTESDSKFKSGVLKVSNVVGAMIPSIIVSKGVGNAIAPVAGVNKAKKVAEIAGVTEMGMAAATQEYGERIKAGDSHELALAKGLVHGAWEGASEYFLGSIEGLANNKLLGLLDNKVAGKIQNALVKSLVKGSLDIVDEGLEEVIQNYGGDIINAVFSGDILDGKIDWTSGEEQWENFLYGMLSALVLNGANAGTGTVREYYDAVKIKSDEGRFNALKNVGMSMSADSVAGKIAGQIDENSSAWKISRLLHNVNAELTEQNQGEISQYLQDNGFRQKDADSIAEWLEVAVADTNNILTRKQIKILDSNPVIASAFNKFIDSNSTVNQRLSGFKKYTENRNVVYGYDMSADANEIGRNLNATYNATQELGLTYDDLTSDTSESKAKVNDAISARLFRNNAINGMERAETRSTDAYLNEQVSDFNAKYADKIAANNGIKTVESVSNKVSENNSTTLESTGEDVKIKKVSSNENGNMKLELADGRIVDSSDVRYRSKDDAVVYETLASMGVPSDVANSVITGWNNSGMSGVNFMLGVDEAYKYGKVGLDIAQELQNSSFASEIPEAVRNIVYRQGVDDAKAEINRKNSGRKKSDTRRKGAVHAPASFKTMTERQKQSIRTVARVAADITNNDVYIYESVLDENGNRVLKEDIPGRNAGQVAPHGVYDPKTGAIYIDLNAGNNGEGVMLYTFAHELTHFVRDWSPAKFKALADFVIAEYGKKGVSVSELIKQKMSARGIGFDEAYEEVIADSMQPMFTDANLGEKLAKLKSQDAGLFAKIKEFFTMMYNKIKALYKGLDPYTDEGKYVKEMKNALDKISDMFAEAVVDAGNTFEVSENNSDGNEKYSFSSIGYTFFGDENISSEDFEKGNYKEQKGYKDYVNNCLSVFMQTHKGVTKKDALAEIVDSIDGIVRVAVASKKAGYDILDDSGKRDIKDSKGRLLFSSLEPNSDYFTSHDISTICDKRKNFAQIYDDIIKREAELGVPAEKSFFSNVDNYFYIHKVLADKGLTQPCRQCYVESMRKNLMPMAKAFLQLINEKDANNKKNPQLYQPSGKNKGNLKETNAKLRERFLEELDNYGMSLNDITAETLTTADGLAELKITAPLLYEAFNSFYGQSKPKMPKSATPFRFGELTALLTDNNGNIRSSVVDKINSTGGFRLQSYSDYQIVNYVDVLQVLFEAGTLGLNGHAYTKVPAFLDATEGTNLKRNISIFMYQDGSEWKLDKNDSFPAPTIEDIYSIVNADKSGNTSIIAVSQNAEMSAYIMANDNIGYGIPFHKSGLKMDTVRQTIVKEGGREIKGYSKIKDHTKQQTEVWASSNADHKAFTKVKNGINIYGKDVNWDFENKKGLTKNELIKKNLMSYIDACYDNGYLPKFREYLMNNEAVLNNVLMYAKELGDVSADATIDDISFKYRGFTIPYGYYKFLGDFGMFTPDGKASPHDTLSLKNYDFDKAVELFGNSEQLRRNEILQQFSNGEERQKYRNSSLTAEELNDIVQQKRSEVVDEIAGKNVKLSDRDVEILDAKYELNPEVKYSERVTDKKLINFLENQDHITTYKAMLLVDGKLYPPMASKVKDESGKYVMSNPRVVGEWMHATEDASNIKSFNAEGVGYYELKKENGGTVKAAYNPYEHSSNLVLNDQFESAYNRPNIVTVKCEIPVSEMTSGYKAEHAKDSVGYLDWHSGVVAGQIKGNKRKVYLSRYLKVVEIMDDSEVARLYKETLGDSDIAVPFNVVTPSLRSELEKIGVKIDYNGTPMYQSLQSRKANNNGAKFSIREEAKKEIQDVLDMKQRRADVKLTDSSPTILLNQKGVKNYPLVMKPSHIRENILTEDEARQKGLKTDGTVNYHGLGIAKFVDVINGLDDVDEAYRGTKNASNPQRREKYFLLISKVTDGVNRINVPVFINETTREAEIYTISNKIATVFGRNNLDDYLKREIRNGNLVRIKKKSLMSVNGTAPIAGDYNNNDLSDSKLSQNESDVNSKYSDRVLMGSVFSGGGTLEAGLVYQMLDKEFAVEYNKKIASVYMDNHGKDHMFVGDIRDFDSKSKDSVFYLHASPVCKNYSAASHKSGEKTIDITTAEATARVLEEQNPEAFTVENVKRYIGSEAYNIITKKLDELGYKWDVDVYKASDYGNATKRERMVIRAVKSGELPAKPAKVTTKTSWYEATKDLFETELIPSTLVKSKIDAIKNTKGISVSEILKSKTPVLIYDTTKSKHITYAFADELAPTLTTKCGDARIVWNGKVYAPTPKFMGRLQGLPDNYKYPKAKSTAFKIIGNGIPVQLTKAVMGGLIDSAYEQTHNGEVLFSERDTESFDNRTLLANAMESVAKNDIEKKYIENYKSKIDAINEEERKLSDLRAEIKELSFSKGKRDTERIKSLQDEATKSANRINTYDKQLLKLEASAPLKSVLEREKASAIKKAEAKAKQALSEYKESAMKRQEEIISRYQEARRRGIDQRQSTKLRNAVKKYIEDFRKRIQHPTDRRYIPSNLVSGIIDVYDMIDPTGENQESLAAQKYRTVKEALADLKLQYDSLAQNVDYDFSSEFDSEFSKRIAELANSVGNVPLRDMSRSQLEDVYEIIHDISVMIHQATKMIGTDEAITNYEAGQEVIENMQSVKRLGLTQNKVETFFREWTLNPMRAVREMSGFDDNSMLVKLFNGLNEGRRKADKFKMDVTKKFDAMRSSKEGRKAFNDAVEKATITVYDTEGKEVKISRMQAMQAILTYEREQANDNRNHLSSPVRFTNVADDVKGKYSNAFDNGHNVYVDENFVQRCRKEFSEWDNSYIDLARRFFNEDSKNAINEVSLLTKHRLTATEKAYIPYKVNSDYISKESDNVKYDASIGGAGILKSVKNNAPQQLVIRGLNALIDEHIDDVAKIYGLTVPVRNFNKVFNMKQTKDDGGIPVKSAIRDTWQDGGLKLLDQAVADIQSNRRTESSKALSSVKSAFVTSTLASNISVWMKQAASYPTAGSILSASSLTKALPNFARNLDNVYEEIDKYTSQHWIRRQGLSSQELGEMNQSHGWQNRLNDKLGVLSPMNWIQAMDVKTTAVLWIACKNEVQSMGIKPSDAEYFDKVTELYDKVIEDTQPMYDSLHRAEITKNSAWKNIIMFQTQPIQNSGILREGAMEYKMAKKQYGKNSKQAKEAFKKFRMAVGSQMASHLTFTAMTLLAAAILHKMNPYRDDDKELTTESVLTEFGKQFEKNFIGAVIPVIGTYATSIIEKFEGGNRYDVVSDPTVDKINSTIDTFSKLSKPSLSNFKDVLVDVSTYFGIPAKNAENIINGVKLHIQDISGSGFLSFEAGVERTGKQDYGRVYESIMDNDTEEIARLKKKYGDKYSSEVRKALADNDSRITEAAKARIDGDVSTYTSIARSIIADGFTQDDVVSAINTKINSLKKGETPTPTSAPKSKSLYDINDFATAIETNNRSMMEEIRNDMIEISVANGKTRESAEESFATSAYNAIKDGYELGQISDTQAVDALVKYGGKSEDYANSKVRFWRFQEEYPEYNITEEQLNKYYNPVEGLGYSINESGISVETYADYVVRRKDCTGTDEDGDGKTDSGSVKAEVLKLIDRLPISNYQKDALYYLNGWSSKTIDDAGWH